MESLEARSRTVQERTFCKWSAKSYLRLTAFANCICRLNTKLESAGHPPMTSLVQDLSDGVRLIQLMVSILLIYRSWDTDPHCPGNHGSVRV
jgi:hypothetical protein